MNNFKKIWQYEIECTDAENERIEDLLWELNRKSGARYNHRVITMQQYEENIERMRK